MKQELRLDFNEDKVLNDIINKCYFEGDNLGKIRGNENYFDIRAFILIHGRFSKVFVDIKMFFDRK